MRVLLISHTCQSRTEGQPKAELLGRLPGMELQVLTPRRWLHYGRWREAEKPEHSSFEYNVQDVSLPWVGPAQNYLHWYPSLRRTLLEFRPDIIDLWEEPWGAVSAHACWLRDRLLPSARIVTETEQNICKQLPPPFEQLRSYTLRRADFAVGRNTESLEILRKKGYRGPMQVVPNAADVTLFRPLERDECRRTLGLSGFVVGYVGRLVEEKGLLDLVDALAHCPPDVNLLFVGSGPLQAELQARAEQAGVAKRIRILPERQLKNLPPVMNAIDVLALPSRTTASWKEQFGRVLIEAHACGTPVIGSSSGAIPEVVGHGGLIVPERDPAALAEAVGRLAAQPAWCRELGAIGQRQVEARYTWGQVAQQMYDIYRSLGTAEPAAPTRLRTETRSCDPSGSHS